MSSFTCIDKELGVSFDEKGYRELFGSLVYEIASRHNIMFSVCLCASYQSNPKESHLKTFEHIFRYHKGTTSLGYGILKT